jgi:thioredoxin reductase
MLDCAVIGDSFAGLLCAVRLRELGHRVGLAIHGDDSSSAEGIWELPGIDGEPERGEVVIGRLRDRLDQLGYEWLHTVDSIACVDGHVRIGVWEEPEVLARATIVSPCGTELRLDGFELQHPPLVSTDAWSDAPFCADKSVVVVGSGSRAASEALYLASKRARVTLVCAAPSLEAPTLIEQVRACPLISLVERTTVEAPITRDGGSIAVLARREDGSSFEIPTTMVFAARGVSYGWRLFGPEAAARACVDAGLVHLAGLAAGLPAWDFAAHLRHAEQTVAAVHERLRG